MQETKVNKKHQMQYSHADAGFCRVYWKYKGYLYCWQECGRGGEFDLEFYACSKDGEPSHVINYETCGFQPVPYPDKYLQQFNDFLAGKGLLECAS